MPPTYTVQRGDSLWAIAEHTLGDPYRWRDIEALNLGRPQPDGGAVNPEGLIRPGWTLVLPADATPTSATSPATQATGGTVITVEPGDTLWDLAAHYLGDPQRWPELYELNANQPQPDGRTLTDPNLILVGWQLELPAPSPPAAPPPSPVAPAPSPAPPPIPTPTIPTPSSPSTPPATTRPSRTRHRHAPPTISTQHTVSAPIPVGVLSAAFAAAGAVGLLASLRRRQARRPPAGRRVPAPPPELAPTEEALRGAAQDSPADWLAAAVRALTAQLHPPRRGPDPQPVAAQLGPDALEIVLAEPADTKLPRPWEVTPDGWIWRLPRTTTLARLRHLAGTAPPGLPTLATIGHTDAGPLLLDLEGCGRVAITGDPETAANLARSLALELSVTPAADVLDVVLLADPQHPEPLAAQTLQAGRLRVLTSTGEALEVDQRRRGQLRGRPRPGRAHHHAGRPGQRPQRRPLACAHPRRHHAAARRGPGRPR